MAPSTAPSQAAIIHATSPRMQAAIGRTAGKLSVDSNGVARYQVKIEVPSGIGQGNEPDLSLIYSQGNPNGILGQGWGLGGLSSVRLSQSSMPYDDPNLPTDYDRSALRYALDGQELLPINGPQGARETLYSTEINEYERRISHLGSGFVILGQAGTQTEYGTTPDSCVLSSDQLSVKEWKMKRQTDIHGNCVTYNYTQSPAGAAGSSAELLANSNTSYVDSIVYTSNNVTGYKGMHQIFFEYKPRPDPVVHTVLGDKVVTASLLSAIRIMVATSPSPTLIRSYEMQYISSSTTGSSCLAKVWECAHHGGVEQLLPTEFTYTSIQNDQGLYELDRAGIQTLSGSSDNVALMPLDVSGCSMTDMTCLRYHKDSQTLSIKTFLASCERNSQSTTVSWKASTGQGAEASLPQFPLGVGHPQPSLLTADLNGDGRGDVVIPFRQAGGYLNFSLSQSTGTGFLDHQIKETYFEWSDESIFMASDVNGDGRTDIIEIFPNQRQLAFRIFTTVTEQGAATLKDARQIYTPHDFGATIQWLQVQTQRNGAKNLVRIHSTDNENSLGFADLYATTFSLEDNISQESDARPGKKSLLGTFENEDASRVSIVACDINGDGVQDLVVCLVKPSGGGDMTDLNFTLTTMLNDGDGAFIQHGEPFKTTISIPTGQMPTEKPKFHTVQRNCADYPTLAYVYQEGESKDFVSFDFQGMCSGFVQSPRQRRIARYADLPGDQAWSITGVDFTGHGLGDWLVYSMNNDVFTVCPVYNRGNLVDHLATVRDPMGLVSQIEYKPLADPRVYTPGVVWSDYTPPGQQSEYTLLAASSYVVSTIKTMNDPKINSIPYYSEIEKYYRRAVVNIRGRGWQGFQSVVSYDKTSDTTTTQTYCQEWPLAGQLLGTTIASGRPNCGEILQVEAVKHEARIFKLGPWTTFRPLKLSQQLDAYDGGRVARSAGSIYAYDTLGNVVLDHTWSSSVQPLYTRYGYQMFKDVIALPTRKKVSSQLNNVSLEVYEAGDYSLMQSAYNPESGLLKSTSHWSTDAHAFTTTTYQFDAYGNEVQSVNGIGLQVATEYDEMYHSLPIKRTETGPGVSLLRLAAYNALTGAMAMVEDADGSTQFILSDTWLRCRETRKRATSVDKESLMSAKDFLGDVQLIGDMVFLKRALDMSTVPDKSFKIVHGPSSTGRRYIYARNTIHHNASGQCDAENIEVVDCVGRVRKKSTRNGNYAATWLYTEDDPRGCRITESFPVTPITTGEIGDFLDWTPQSKDCVVSTYDSLRRLSAQTKSSHSDESTSVTMRRSYAKGGAEQHTTIVEESPGMVARVLSSTTEYFLNINGEDRLTKKVDESGQATLFEYNLLGKLTKITDPAGKMETREYNSGNQISVTNDSYRNTLTRVYDLGNHLTQEIDALGQKVTYVRDAKGRLREQQGEDGRTVRYEYDGLGRDLVTSICTTAHNSATTLESRFDFEYDARGRRTKQTVTCEGKETFSLQFVYNWQDQVTQKVLPDQSVITREYGGAVLASTSMKGDGWKVSAEYQKYNSAGKPEKWTINNHGSVSQSFSNEIKYDKMSFPTSHTLSIGSGTLVQNHYLFNGLNQLTRTHEFGTGETTDYQYQCNRLVSYQESSSTARQYTYDLSGNMSKNGEIEMAVDGTSLHATRKGQHHFSIEYDRCGRMTRRSTSDAQFDFKYDSFGKMSSMINKTSSNDSTDIICNYLGHTLIKKRADGTREIMVDPAYSMLVRANGSRQIQRKWRGQDRQLATIRSEIPSSSSSLGTATPQEQHSISLYYSDTKGNVTHIYRANGDLQKRLRYDPFGGLLDPPSESEKDSTYESNSLDLSTMMYDFAARWYDPLACRFTTADDIVDEKLMKRTDGSNRFTFENNDPINYIDPTGHWTLSSIFGFIIGVALVITAVVVSILTAGAASPLAVIAFGALTGALMSGGINAITYSLDHKNESEAGRFWKGYGATVGIGMATGAITGAFTAGVGCAIAMKVGAQVASRAATAVGLTWSSVARTALSVGSRALASGLSSLVNKIGSNMIERDIYGRTDIDYDSGLGMAFGIGILTGAASAIGGDYWGGSGKQHLQTFLEDQGMVWTGLATGVVAFLGSLATMPTWHKFTDDYGYVRPDDEKKN